MKTSIYLTEEDEALLDQFQLQYRLATRIEAIRLAVRLGLRPVELARNQVDAGDPVIIRD